MGMADVTQSTHVPSEQHDRKLSLVAVDTVWATEVALASMPPSMSTSAQLNCLRRGFKYHWKTSGIAKISKQSRQM